MAKVLYSSLENLKNWSEKYWSKKETGDSWWDGYFRKALYHYELEDSGIDHHNRVEDLHDVRVPDSHRRGWLVSSDYGREWHNFDLTKCFRVDQENARIWDGIENYMFPPRPPRPFRTLEHAMNEDVEDDSYWQTTNYDYANRFTTPAEKWGLNTYPWKFPGMNFGWMYRVLLQRFFMEKSIEYYDVQKGMEPDWVIPIDDLVWENKNAKPGPITVPYPSVNLVNEEIPPETAPVKEGPPEGPPEVKAPPPLEIDPPPPVIDDFGAKFLIPLITLAEEDAKKTRTNLRGCFERRKKLGDEKKRLCRQYNAITADRIYSEIARYKAEAVLLEANIREEMVMLNNLWRHVNSRRGTSAKDTIPRRDDQKKVVLDMIKELKARCQRLSN